MHEYSAAEAALITHGDSLYRIALGMLRSPPDAEDAVSETMVRYLRADAKFGTREHEKAWLIAVLLNVCRDLLKMRARHPTVPIDLIAEPIAEPSRDVLDLLAKLPIESRQVLILHYIEGYSVRETAKLIGIGESAAKMRLKSARERFKKMYKGEAL